MDFPMNFISAIRDLPGPGRLAPAPYLRRSFALEEKPAGAEIVVCGLGFYELYVNGERITKGRLSPYISNPDDIVYYDVYDAAAFLTPGENVIGLWLGNGFANHPFNSWWDFEKARFNAPPKAALRLTVRFGGKEDFVAETGEDFLSHDSPVWYDYYRHGEYYDARKEIKGWSKPGFDASGWKSAVRAELPRGEARVCEAAPIAVTEELAPVSVTETPDGWLYDFGRNCAGVCRLKVSGRPGQEIGLFHGEHLIDGRLDMKNINNNNDMWQKDIYICAGGGEEVYTPTFVYHGFRYVLAKGLDADQAVPGALTYLVMSSGLKERGGFTCSDETVNTLQALTRRSTLANFFHFPTDCPQREKNGWTADAALSAEHALLNLNPEKNYEEWLRNIRKAMDERGALPGIVPTGGWGFEWGNGPAWDCVLTWLPYYVYVYRGDKAVLRENAHAILRYLEYLAVSIRGDGLIELGLGDWCPAGRGAADYKSPVCFTDTVVSMDIARKAEYIYGELGAGYEPHRDFARRLKEKLRKAARERLIDFGTMTAMGNCQTSQAMAVSSGLFTEAERPEAVRRLLEIIARDGSFLDVGVLGARVLFHVLAEAGHVDLALEMITRPEFPSYGWWVRSGAASLWEEFKLDTVNVASLNHHFWGDVSHFFIRQLAGINYNPRGRCGEADIVPRFAKALDFAEGFHIAPEGEIKTRWERKDG
ncbi:MAG: family 78 glycoside hydrolase catalytic domain, partial [Firmicutes bacterium]|nr:family 78 glycoside hydrolase catalytic domain [Bacillota bacterium]